MKLKTLIIFILALFFSAPVYSQPRRERTQFVNHILLSEIYKLPYGNAQDSSEVLYYFYRIPYNILVFEKNNDDYSAYYRLTVEIHDSVSNTIDRKMKEDKILVQDFDKTDSRNSYAQGFLSFQISKQKTYNLYPILFDENSGREVRLNKIPILRDDEKNNRDHYLEPLVVDSKQPEHENSNSFIISNFEGSIPFGEKDYDLLIPCKDTSVQKIYVRFINDKDTLLSENISRSVTLNNSFEEVNGNIVLNNHQSSPVYKNFIIPFVNKKLYECDLEIQVSAAETSKSFASFNKSVRWFDKPLSLLNPELAIKFLKYMENDQVIDSLLDFKKKEYERVLFDFWKHFDPTPETAFNELMNEYYSRIDYTMKNFSSISGKRGFDTDRGKVFILYGKPFDMERTSNQFGKIIETWIYKNPERKFVFIDETGTGEYQLKNG